MNHFFKIKCLYFSSCISSQLLLVLCLPVEHNLSQQLLPLLLVLVGCLNMTVLVWHTITYLVTLLLLVMVMSWGE